MNVKILNNIFSYRSFIFASVKREFQSKYQNSMLGATWTVLNPLAMIFVYTVIFSQVMQAKLAGSDSSFAYSIYLCAGILTWGFFAEIVSRGQNIFIENATILKKINFPRITLPIIMLLSAGLNFFIVFSLFIGALIITGNFPGVVIISMLPVLLIQVLFSMGLGISLGVLNVFFRDIGQLFTILLQFWFWLTPVIYPITILPEYIRPIVLTFNPLAPIIGSYQVILVSAQLPDWSTLITPLSASIILCIFALRLYSKHVDEIMDEI